MIAGSLCFVKLCKYIAPLRSILNSNNYKFIHNGCPKLCKNRQEKKKKVIDPSSYHNLLTKKNQLVNSDLCSGSKWLSMYTTSDIFESWLKFRPA